MSLLLQLVSRSRWTIAAALIASVLGGLGNAALLALINQALIATPDGLARLGLQFLAVGLVVLAMRALAQSLFMWLGQQAKATLRMRTIRRIGDAAFAQLEKQGAAKSLAVLTQDLDTIVVFFVSLPSLAMQSAVIAGCLAYLGYMSWPILLVAIVTIVLGMTGFRYAHSRAMFHLRASRKREDDLVRHFRALFDGAKELKLHRARKRAFVEDTLATTTDIEREFGQEVAFLVDGVTKLSKINFASKEDRQAENFRKMLVAMARDIRVLLVKLCDRLDNMRTLEFMKPEAQDRIARETMEIYAPLANRLGIARFKSELEDLSFRYTEPDAYADLQGKI